MSQPQEKQLPKWKTEKKENKQEKVKERTVNPMTMIPADVSISGRMPLPPNAEHLKRLYGL
jgi:hypothetical protein